MRKVFQLNMREANVGALDFSYLQDKPAGVHGYLKTSGERLVFEDGTEARFWGTNVVGGACAPEHEVADIVAKRLASAGFNLLRFHYMDGTLDLGTGGTVGTIIDYSQGNTRHLNETALERMDYFIKALNDNGIYVHIDLFVGRTFMLSDGLDYDEEFPTSWGMKQYNIFNNTLKELMKEFNYNLLTHVNQYKGIRYADDPGIAFVQVNNENSLLWDMGTFQGATKIASPYLQELMSKWRQWLKEKYKTQEALVEAWTNEEGVCGVLSGEHIDFYVAVPTDSYFTNNEAGTPHTSRYDALNSPERTAEYIAFLTELENKYTKEMYDYLRDTIGVKCVIATSNLIRGITNAYTASVNADVAENDAYYNHPSLGFDPPARCTTFPMIYFNPLDSKGGLTEGNLISQLAPARVSGKPFVVAEWNDVFPTEFTSEANYMIASYGAFQGWSGMCCFYYSGAEQPEEVDLDKLDFYFVLGNNPSIFGEAGVCAKVFRKGLVKEASTIIDVTYTKEDLMANNPITKGKPYSVLPYLSKTRVDFTANQYQGDADIAIRGGFTASGDVSEAKHAIVYTESPYDDAYQKKNVKETYLNRYRENDTEEGLAAIGSRYAVVEDGGELLKGHHYGEVVNKAAKKWGVIPEERGIVGGKLISDTGEICFDTEKKQFTVDAPEFGVFSGDITGPIRLGPATLELTNSRMSVSLLSLDDQPLSESRHMLLTGVGDCCNSDMKRDGDWLLYMGNGPIWVDELEGELRIPNGENTRIYALNPNGERAEELVKEQVNGEWTFDLNCEASAIAFEVEVIA